MGFGAALGTRAPAPGHASTLAFDQAIRHVTVIVDGMRNRYALDAASAESGRLRA